MPRLFTKFPLTLEDRCSFYVFMHTPRDQFTNFISLQLPPYTPKADKVV
jgi:hypothetical protein